MFPFHFSPLTLTSSWRTSSRICRSHDVGTWPAIAATLGIVLLLQLGGFAQLPQPRLVNISPPAAAVGNQVDVSIAGEFTETCTELIFSHSGISATQNIEAPTDFRTAHRRPQSFQINVAQDVPAGTYEVRALGPTGLSNPRCFLVTHLAETARYDGDHGRAKPIEVQINQGVSLRARPDQMDYFQMSGEQGVPLLVQVWSRRLDSRMDAVFTIYDEGHRRVDRAVTTQGADPVLMFTPPQHGVYFIEVHDRTFLGGDEYFYRLEVSRMPLIEAIHPVVVPWNTTTEVTLFGFNLPGGERISQSDALGHLQQLRLQLDPRQLRDVPLANAIHRSEPSAATTSAVGRELPPPLSLSGPISLIPTDLPVAVDQLDNDQPEKAQSVVPPCAIAGQFFPRRDVDWFEFPGTKGTSLMLNVVAQRLGSTSDVALRVRKKKMTDGNVTYQEVSFIDDQDADANSRERRRFHSGSNDVSLRLDMDEDVVYQVSVRDHYNTVVDDPRLVYHLEIRPITPDFRLIVYPNPDRFGDEKQVKPNGLSLLPGGTDSLRVRLLPEHGFNESVRVTLEPRPPGISAEPIYLNERQPEGVLVLSAAVDAKPRTDEIQIVGRVAHGAERRQRIAVPATLTQGPVNLDAERSKVRLTRNLVVSILDAPPPAATLRLIQSDLATCPGGKLPISLEVERRNGFDGELELIAYELPKGFKVDSVKTKNAQAELALSIEDKQIARGRYTFPLSAKVKEKRPRSSWAVREVEADLAKIKERSASEVNRKQMLDGLLEAATAKWQTEAVGLTTCEEQLKGMSQELSQALQAEQQIAVVLAERLNAAAQNAGDNKIRGEIGDLEQQLTQRREQRVAIDARIQEQNQQLEQLRRTVQAFTDAKTKAQQDVDQAAAFASELQKQLAETETRLADVRKNQLEQEHEYWVYSPTVCVEIEPTPVELHGSHDVVPLRPGERAEVTVSVQRKFGFRGPVQLTLQLPPELGAAGSVIQLPADQSTGKFFVTAQSDAKVGRWQGMIKSVVRFHDVDLASDRPLLFEVVPPPQP